MTGDLIAELIVVEGANDANAVHRAVKAEVLTTDGFAMGDHVEDCLLRAADHHGVIVLTDPDPAGEQIRARITRVVPDCKHARLAAAECRSGAKVGVEHASAAAICRALAEVRFTTTQERVEFTQADLWAHRLTAHAGARERRARLGEHLRIGVGNARQLLRRLNRYGVSRAEFEAALEHLPPTGG